MHAAGRESVRATYTIRPDARPEDDRETDPHMKIRFPGPPISAGVRTYIVLSAAAIVALIIVLVFTIAGLIGANGKLSGQASQIRALNQANARMSTQLSQVTSTIKGMSATLSGQNPSADTSLLTCKDLARMGLTITTGGSVSSVPGSVSLSQTPVKLPPHCSAKKG